jgi:membrane-associated phospholipid phosphatase
MGTSVGTSVPPSAPRALAAYSRQRNCRNCCARPSCKPAYGVASLVAAQRVYRRAHWASDVVVAATLSVAVTRRIVRVVDRS